MTHQVPAGEFLRSVFHTLPAGAVPVVAGFSGDPLKVSGAAWHVSAFTDPPPRCLQPGANHYFATASCIPDETGAVSRTAPAAVHCLVLDDIGAMGKVDPERIPLAPSWELETSPDNCQFGYILREPLADFAAARRLLEALGRAGFTDKNGGNPVRLVRLPGGVNGKASVVEFYGEPFASVLHQWQPDRRYSVPELVAAFVLDLAPVPPITRTSNEVPPTREWNTDRARKLAWDCARRTVEDPALGRHSEVFRLGAYAGRDGLPAAALDAVLEEFSRLMRPTDSAGRPSPLNWEAERKTIEDGWRRGRAEGATGDYSALFPAAPPPVPDPFAQTDDGWGAAATPPAGPHLVDVPLDGIAQAELDPPSFIIKPLLPREHTTLLGSHGGVGKSVLALALAAHVAAGRRWGGLDVAQGKVLFLSFEDPPALILFRLRRILTAFNLDPDTVTAALRIIDATEAEPLAQEVSAHGVRRLHLTPTAAIVAELCQGYDLVILDNASDCFDAEENSRRQVRGFIRELTRWVKGRGAALLLLVHIDKTAARYGASGNTYSGSTAWHNSARSRLALAPKDHVIELTHEKLNVGPRMAEPLPLAWSEEGVLVPIDQSGRQAALALEAGEEEAAVLRAIKAALSAGETISTARSGAGTAWHCLARFPELPPALRAKPGRERVEGALVRLAQAGVIRREAFKDANRKQKERWML